MDLKQRIVLAFSGGHDTSAGIAWLKAQYDAEVVAVTLDLGQGGDLEAVRDRALALGAARAHVLDSREAFARDFVLPALKADALYEDRYPLGAALAWPLIARTLADIAAIEHATGLAHGGARKDGDVSALGATIQIRNPTLEVVPLPIADEGPNPSANLWGRSVDCGAIDDPWREPPEDLYTITRAGQECPNEPAYVELAFDRGAPTAINGVPMPLVDLIGSLTTIAGAHGVGRLDLLEHRGAVKSRRVYEAPAAIVLHTAHRELTKLVSPRELDRFSRMVRAQYADLLATGQWFTPFREALDLFVDKVQERVTGEVRLKLFKGACRPSGRKSPHAPARSAPAADSHATLVGRR
jgi:argininosuccinate synthase